MTETFEAPSVLGRTGPARSARWLAITSVSRSAPARTPRRWCCEAANATVRAAPLARFGAVPSDATSQVDGHACDLATAVAAAARLLAASRQPLFGGLGTDVAGARALYPLACSDGRDLRRRQAARR